MPTEKTGLPLEPALEDSIPLAVFKTEVRAWAERIGVTPQLLTVRPMKRKWASCSSKGNLTFDTTLLHQSASFRRKVIVHELLHLKYPNHGKMFHAMEKMYLAEAE
ncbi:MAG TPA: M48 family metallopeptidase [Anaerolineales bacterium]|nr:M48 family metallopeptidase [Anaerolineales bacterium]